MRALAATLAVLIVVAVAAESAAAAPVGGAVPTAVTGSFAVGPRATLEQWTPARRAAAEPMSALPLTRAGTLGDAPLFGARGAGETASTGPTTSTVSPSGPIDGHDTGDPTLFPNRANGTVYGRYAIPGEPNPEYYQCSGSVIDSPAGDVVLTAGHCVIDPETGTVAQDVIFVPGYREVALPFGFFAANGFVTTPEWKATAGTADPDEAGDMAMLVLAPNSETKASVEATVGSLAIAFEQPRSQTYTEWGYPAEAPYPEGEILYSLTSPYAGADPFYPSAIAPLRIASDFTAGASGGPWTIGPTTAPTVLSLTDYFYESDRGHLYGAYFGSAARKVYETAAGVVVPPVTISTPTEPTVPAESTPAPTPAATPPAAATPTTPSRVSGHMSIRDGRVRSSHGKATLFVHVDGPGTLRLSGAAIDTVTVTAAKAGYYRLTISAKPGGSAARALSKRGSATVGVWVRFTSPVGVRHASRLVRLVD